MSYDAVSRLSRVEEKVGGSVDKATSYTYDENGNPKTRTHTDQYAAFEYDVRDLVTRASNGESATDPSMQVSTFGYNVRAELARETKPNGNTVDFTYYVDGLLKYQVEKKSAGTLVAEHSVAYDLNGNRVQDVSQTMSADDHGVYLDRTYAYTFDPRDRIAKVVKTDTSSGATLATETYVHDAANNVISQTLKSVTTTFSYDRNRLVTATTGVAIAGYNYDPFGRLDTVTSAGLVLERYSYDGFDRITEFAEMTGPGSTETTSYLYDPLDRSASRTENVGTATEETTEFAYLGLSNEVLAEEIDQQVSMSYQYSPWGQRLSQIKHNADGTDEASFYGYNAPTRSGGSTVRFDQPAAVGQSGRFALQSTPVVTQSCPAATCPTSSATLPLVPCRSGCSAGHGKS